MAGNVSLWSTTALTNASADPDVNWAEGQLPGTVNGSARGMMAAVAGWLKDTNGTLTTGGSANGYTLTANVAYTALATGLQIGVKANHSNTGASTFVLTPAGGAAFASKAIRVYTVSGDSALSANMIRADGQYNLRYDAAANAAAGAWILLNPTITLSTLGVSTYAQTILDDTDAAAVRTTIHAPLKGHIYGLTLANNGTDATNDIDIAEGEAADSDGLYLIQLAAGLTKRLDAGWAVGTGNGGLDTGSIADTTYFVFLIQRSDTGVVDALFSTSPTAPTMPANYDRKRRIGAIIRASSALKAFTQYGDKFMLLAPVQDVSTAAQSTTSVTYTLASVPAGIVVTALINAYASTTAASSRLYVRSLAQTDAATSLTNINLRDDSGAAEGVTALMEIETNTSAQIAARASAAVTLFVVNTRGWYDSRGR